MISLTFGQIETWTGGELLHCPRGGSVAELSIDSRQVRPGVLFVALPGTHTDGHAFVEEVWRAGGVAMVRRDYPNQEGPQIRVASPLEAMGRLLRQYLEAHQVTVVGVTGSVGKTSVKELTAAVLRQRYVTSASLGNYNTAIGLPLSFFAGPADTTHFVAEMGMSAPGEIRHLTAIAPPDVAVISTIGPSHLEKLGSMEAIQKAKGEILEGLKPSGLAILNHDNGWVRELGEKTPRRVHWFGTGAGMDGQVLSSEVEETHTLIRVSILGEEGEVRLPWLGAHQGQNVAAALLVARELGLDLATAIHGVESVEANRSRIRVVKAGSLTLLEDVYNASPLSAKAALDVLESRPGRHVAVIGDMLELGGAEVPGHREVGAYAGGRADLLLAVGARARDTFLAAQEAGVEALWVLSRQEALAVLEERILPGDVVLMKASRGMQFEELARWLEDWGRSQ
ncbi:MAG: UDP-N-acetylmuramoyl-tripeptide--D-alanyl-D-alanine ligase [Firmicutes bacterium]|nr:UDP-N-acetylmuramoyl-tripeptide--D-alanyl-D-alanine ligase [Bacillota bacterium]